MTNQPSELVITTQALTAQIGALVKGDETLTEVQQVLGAMWEVAEQAHDQQRLEIIGFAWEKAQALAQAANTAVDTAQVAAQVISAIEAQRDALAKSAEELMKAIDHLDYDHPVVQQFYDDVNAEIWDNVSQSECYVSECPACDMTTNGTNEYIYNHLNHDTAGIFFNLLMGDPDEDLTDDLAKELCDFVIAFVQKVHDHAKAQAS